MKNDSFVDRHNGITGNDLPVMLNAIGVKTLDNLIDLTIPSDIKLKKPLQLPPAMSEYEYSNHILSLAEKNKIFKTYIGMGYYNTITPAVIWRNVFENPVWYTSYTPYQAEISQGRLEALLNFQTMVSDLTALPLTNASLLDEATAAAEAMTMFHNTRSKVQEQAGVNTLLVDKEIWDQTLSVLQTRSVPQGISLLIADVSTFDFSTPVFGAIIQYPNANGDIIDYASFVEKAHAHDCRVAVATDLLALTLLTPPGEWGADVAFGSSQRFGIPLSYGGPSAAFFATRDSFKRDLPGRIIGISKDTQGRPVYRLALQTREQHIKREKATSNICTAQALLATMAGFYAVYHGPEGLKRIANRIYHHTETLAKVLTSLGFYVINTQYFDTLKISCPAKFSLKTLRERALKQQINLRYFSSGEIGISIDETTGNEDIAKLIKLFSTTLGNMSSVTYYEHNDTTLPLYLQRSSPFLQQPVFNKYHSETEMMRYIKKLERKDISLAHSMISLGSCTMKLNAAAEMLPLNHPAWGTMHPFVPSDQAQGYHEMFARLKDFLSEITGFPAVTFQPNSGAAGEYTGLITIRNYFKSQKQSQRNVILIPSSAHGTNPASAVQAGYEVVVVNCDDRGNVDVADLRTKAEQHKEQLAALMITYPSTHGVFESAIREICDIVHNNGGQVYMDGANMNAQVGLTSPATIGADICHLNLHKTFAIPHGGGGPGVGPVCAASHLAPYLPQHPVIDNEVTYTAVAAAPYGSAAIYAISYGYICMMGAEGLTDATKIAILNANYLAAKLKDTYGIVYSGETGRVGHEMILECRHFKATSGITETDIAKRLMDFGFHAPTLSFPVHGTLMVEPTESESLAELDRFVETMLTIYNEIKEIENGTADRTDNVLLNSPHCEFDVMSDAWSHSYSREKAAYPLEWVRENKFWLQVGRVDNAYGDRNLVCTCK
ncbi:aminomethyl-transferring glycine dehydrogenase [Microbacter margulisiae]|uniref:Glycine dehydrogenase (decarboxylating) n=1 Tax=Microbacter margulisiae TaxID=1350067 RepID=A0A7W5H264_9PORP|nr:aminomethyl-transferring glycine dehydrogenase [Microbacter margulisiae]MBB3187097.1 glycine dehydrogenase [Microbacter margulisiae]